ncbi:MAG: 23S rRNA (guanosine(2251)-2'-O)-methyltransferase RlmB [Filifactoraceae bacterium]
MQIEGRNPVIEALKSDRAIDHILIKRGDGEGSIKKIIGMAKDKSILIKSVDKKKLDEIATSDNHQGVIAIINDYKYYELSELVAGCKDKKDVLFIILDEIEDPHNLGAIIRTANACNADGVIIPKRRAATINSTVEKTSAGAISFTKVAKVNNISQAIETLKKENIWIYALDMDGERYSDTNMKGRVALVVGNEGKGISRLVKEKSDFTVSIPLLGEIESLNASVATSVIMYEIIRQRGCDG